MIPVRSNSVKTFSGSPTSRLMEGSSVTTVTPQPSPARCVAMFQVLTLATAVAGGNEYARNSSLGLLFNSMLLMASLSVKVAPMIDSKPITPIRLSDRNPNAEFCDTTIVNHGTRITLRYNSSSSLFKALVSNLRSTCLLPACPISSQTSGWLIR